MGAVPQHFYRQSGVVPCRMGSDGLEVLLVTTRRSGRWIIPKGVVEPDLSPQESARREAAEEAGVDGVVGPEVGVYTRDKWGGTCRIRVYLMEVTHVLDDWPEASVRRREWLPADDASRRVPGRLRPVLRRVPKVWKRWRRR